MLDGAALIGRTVIAEGNQVYRYVPAEGEAIPTQGAVEVPAGASSVQLVVRDSAGTLVKTQAIDDARGPARLHVGRQHRRRHHRALRRLQDRSHRQSRRQERFAQHQLAAQVSSVALDPATGALTLDTDTLGEIAMSDVERVL